MSGLQAHDRPTTDLYGRDLPTLPPYLPLTKRHLRVRHAAMPRGDGGHYNFDAIAVCSLGAVATDGKQCVVVRWDEGVSWGGPLVAFRLPEELCERLTPKGFATSGLEVVAKYPPVEEVCGGPAPATFLQATTARELQALAGRASAVLLECLHPVEPDWPDWSDDQDPSPTKHKRAELAICTQPEQDSVAFSARCSCGVRAELVADLRPASGRAGAEICVNPDLLGRALLVFDPDDRVEVRWGGTKKSPVWFVGSRARALLMPLEEPKAKPKSAQKGGAA